MKELGEDNAYKIQLAWTSGKPPDLKKTSHKTARPTLSTEQHAEYEQDILKKMQQAAKKRKTQEPPTHPDENDILSRMRQVNSNDPNSNKSTDDIDAEIRREKERERLREEIAHEENN